ncbi:MAG: asparagine synthase (glutamine-hydrolyzing) [Clostridia bacterium]|nr:asparagine synthase (glutamine-hydrolyzing) [Clostridia bacterium]
MCGIAGWIDWENDLTRGDRKKQVKRMMEVLAHRGPDADGMWVSQRVSLVHRRLIVVDPEGGLQPMVRQAGNRNHVIVYNGELYNTDEVRQELQARGHNFYSRSDTEVILVGYLEWGPACVEHYNGIFAFAIWDDGDETLYLARDRMGVKPLFYSYQNNRFIFASEQKALLANPYVEPKINLEGLAEILLLGPARTPGHGVFKEISEIKPGHYLILNRNGLKTGTYWALESCHHEDDLKTTLEKARYLFCDAVSRQLVADVPVCTLLSGGVDSSAITAVAAQELKRQGNGPIHTYSVDFIDNDIHFKSNNFQPDSDNPWIKVMVEYLTTKHHYINLGTMEQIKALGAAVHARDLPGMADVDASLLLFCQQIKKGATVALSGECADEIFGGYPWFHREDLINSGTFPWSTNIDMREKVLSHDLRKRLNPRQYIQDRYQEALSEVPKIPGEGAREARIREILYLTITRWMPTLLDRKDRMSMAVGLEVRVPFCDHRLVEYAWNIPWGVKQLKGREKGLLRKALAGILPDDILWRKKSPYPKTHNPQYLQATKNLVKNILTDKNSPILPLINVSFVNNILKNSQKDIGLPWFGQLMGEAQFYAYLYQINCWLKAYKIQIV